ncbi:DUF3907 family protein [Bacillus fonticola]|uniref:DUF3907 family protein n=1 Tax=Bacillus fonticola TaxID=2728853 RepID=UPI001475E9EA|nr:DUF3907 family protein [Bacillus fonticola]
MGNQVLQSQITLTQAVLSQIVKKFEQYVTTHDRLRLLEETTGDKAYYDGVLRDLRRLLVFCEEALDSCGIVLRNEPLSKTAAEKTLYSVYHHCVDDFYNPRSDLWYEDSRAAYTGRNAIHFRATVPPSLQALMASVEAHFQELREELDFYETDYQTKVVQHRS